MNKYLEDFFDDELKTNPHYDAIRDFAKDKDWIDILSDVINDYDKNGKYFNPYKFMDAIEDYLEELYADNNELVKTADGLYEIIDKMWYEDYFENY